MGKKNPNPPTNPTPTGCNPAPCPDPCLKQTFGPREVNVTITQVMTGAPPQYASWNNTYTWQCRFTLTVDRTSCSVTAIVKVRVEGTITEAQKASWRSAILASWNNRAKLVCPDNNCPGACANGYRISVDLQFVDSGEHQVVHAGPATLNMGEWGASDSNDVDHEFGHMLGAPDEYFTVNGVDYTYGGTRQPIRDPAGGIMNNPANLPTLANYDVVRTQAQTSMGTGVNCTTQAV